MPRKNRLVVPGLPHHVTQRGNNRQAVFFTEEDRKLYLEMLFEQCGRWQVKVAGYCLMTNHVHILLIPCDLEGISHVMCRLQSDYARILNLRQSMCGHLWHERFYSCPMADGEAMRALAYIETNPVRAAMVEHVVQHRWSSARAHLRGFDPDYPLDFSLWSRYYTPESWREVLASAEAEEAWQKRFRLATLRGIPLGPEEFVALVEERTGRRIGPGKIGRPKKGENRLSTTAA